MLSREGEENDDASAAFRSSLAASIESFPLRQTSSTDVLAGASLRARIVLVIVSSAAEASRRIASIGMSAEREETRGREMGQWSEALQQERKRTESSVGVSNAEFDRRPHVDSQCIALVLIVSNRRRAESLRRDAQLNLGCRKGLDDRV